MFNLYLYSKIFLCRIERGTEKYIQDMKEFDVSSFIQSD